MTETLFEARFQRIVRQVLDTRVDLLAIMMTEAAIDPPTIRERLTTLVHALRNPRVEKTIFENGRRMATMVEGNEILINFELLNRVGDTEVLNALARPVAQITQLAPVGVSLAFQIDDDQLMRDLTMKAQRRGDGEVVRASSIPDWVGYRIETLIERVTRLTGDVGRATILDRSTTEEVQKTVEQASWWPEWSDVSDIEWCKYAVAELTGGLSGTPYEAHAETLAELLWDSVVLSTQSFVRHAGRTARTLSASLDVSELIVALANAVSGDEHVSPNVADWPAYQDVFESWRTLNRHERAMFGPVLLNDQTPSASVVIPAQLAFGLDEPKELPWDMPLVCWTTREQRALRDLLIGFIKTLPGHTEHALEGYTQVELGDESGLRTDGERLMLSVQVIPLGEPGYLAPQANDRTWAACVRHILDQFQNADEYMSDAILASLRSAYDQLFPESRPIWARRFFDLHERSATEQFLRLVTTVNHLFNAPVFLDPYVEPGADEPAALASLVLPVGLSAATEGKIALFVPIVALNATLNGAPVRVRVVEVPPQSDTPCRWHCDRAVHLEKLAEQSVELLTRAVRGDALQMGLS